MRGDEGNTQVDTPEEANPGVLVKGPGPVREEPPQLPGTPRRAKRRLVAGVVVGGLVLGVALGIGVIGTGLVRGGGTAHTPTSQQLAETRDTAIDAALATMEVAVRNGDEAAFLSVVDPAATDFRAHQQRVFRNLQALSDAVTVRYSWDRTTLPVPEARAYATDGVVAAVTVTHQFPSYDTRPVADVVGLSFAPAGGHWYLVADTDADGVLPLGGQYEPWAFTEVSVLRGKDVLLIGDPEHSAEDRQLKERLEAELAEVRSMWPGQEWNGKVVAYAGTAPDFVAAWFGDNATTRERVGSSEEATFEAKVRVLPREPVATADDAYLPGAARLVVTPYLLESDAKTLEPVLRHELTHIALAGVGARRPATWLVEGVAEYTGFRTVTASGAVDGVGSLSARGISRTTWANLKQNTWKPRLISDDSLYTGTGTEVDEAYTSAWFTCLYIADHYGETKLRALYTNMAGQDTSLSDAAAEDAALHDVLDVDRATLQTRVRSYARTLRKSFA
ncbi:MAG: hypothetical protein P8Z68_03085 [Kineosporiaceae bacterium]